MTTVGSLDIQLAADVARFQSGLKRASSDLNSFQSKTTRALADIDGRFSALGGTISKTMGALGVGIAAGGLAAMTKHAIATADALAKTADRLGVTTDGLQALRFSAGLAGVETSTLEEGLKKLNVKLAEAAQGNKAVQREFAALGIATHDANGRIRSTEAVFKDLADRIADLQDPAEKTRVSMALLGKGGADMINMLSGGSKSLEATAEQARRLGLIIDEKLLRGAEAASDQLSIMSQVLQIKLTTALLRAAPAVGTFADGIVVLTNAAAAAAEALGQMFGLLEKPPVPDGEQYEKLARLMERAQHRLNLLRKQGNKRDAEEIALLEKQVNSLRQRLDAVRDRMLAAAGAPAAPAAQPASQPIIGIEVGAQDDHLKAWEQAMAAQKRLADQIEAEGKRVFAATREPMERYALEIDRLSGLLKAGAIDQDTFNRAVDQAKNSMEQADAQVQDFNRNREEMFARGKALYEQMKTPLEQYRSSIAELNELLRMGAIDQTTYNRAVEHFAKVLDQAERGTDELKRSAEAALDLPSDPETIAAIEEAFR